VWDCWKTLETSLRSIVVLSNSKLNWQSYEHLKARLSFCSSFLDNNLLLQIMRLVFLMSTQWWKAIKNVLLLVVNCAQFLFYDYLKVGWVNIKTTWTRWDAIWRLYDNGRWNHHWTSMSELVDMPWDGGHNHLVLTLTQSPWLY
jgi:hypothetical protein